MIIDSASYSDKSGETIKLIVNGKPKFVPVDKDNIDYQEIKKQIDKGVLVVAVYTRSV